MFHAVEGTVKGLEVLLQGGVRIKIERRANLLRNGCYRYFFTIQLVIYITLLFDNFYNY